jgi:hypothetical protein
MSRMKLKIKKKVRREARAEQRATPISKGLGASIISVIVGLSLMLLLLPSSRNYRVGSHKRHERQKSSRALLFQKKLCPETNS